MSAACFKTLQYEGKNFATGYVATANNFFPWFTKNEFPYHFKKIIVRYKKIGYSIDNLRQTARLVVNPIKVNSFAYLFNCTMVGRASN